MKKAVCIVLLIFSALTAVFAAGSFRWKPFLVLQGGGNFFMPSVSALKADANGALPAVRTSWYAGGDLMVCGFSSERFDFGGGLSFGYASRSLAAGTSMMKRYAWIGGAFSFNYRFNSVFGLGAGIRLLCGTFFPLFQSVFDIVEAELVPSFRLADGDRASADLSVPLTASFKKDGVTLRAGLGVRVALEPRAAYYVYGRLR